MLRCEMGTANGRHAKRRAIESTLREHVAAIQKVTEAALVAADALAEVNGSGSLHERTAWLHEVHRRIARLATEHARTMGWQLQSDAAFIVESALVAARFLNFGWEPTPGAHRDPDVVGAFSVQMLEHAHAMYATAAEFALKSGAPLGDVYEVPLPTKHSVDGRRQGLAKVIDAIRGAKTESASRQCVAGFRALQIYFGDRLPRERQWDTFVGEFEKAVEAAGGRGNALAMARVLTKLAGIEEDDDDAFFAALERRTRARKSGKARPGHDTPTRVPKRRVPIR